MKTTVEEAHEIICGLANACGSKENQFIRESVDKLREASVAEAVTDRSELYACLHGMYKWQAVHVKELLPDDLWDRVTKSLGEEATSAVLFAEPAVPTSGMTVEDLIKDCTDYRGQPMQWPDLMRRHFTQAIAEAVAAKDAELAEVKKKLPAEMQECSIVLKSCSKGHSWLTAANWIQHGCSTCELESLQADLAALRKPVQKVTIEETKVIWELLLGGKRTWETAAQELDKFFEPRAAAIRAECLALSQTAVQLERAQTLQESGQIIRGLNERHAAELAANENRHKVQMDEFFKNAIGRKHHEDELEKVKNEAFESVASLRDQLTQARADLAQVTKVAENAIVLHKHELAGFIETNLAQAIKINNLSAAVEAKDVELAACRTAHATLARGIKKALGLENWPDFHELYGSGEFATGVTRYLKETLAEADQRWQERLKKVEADHAAELIEIGKGWLNRENQVMTANDQRWQERLKKVENDCQERVDKWQEMNRALNESAAKSQEKAVATNDKIWQERLAKVEAQHVEASAAQKASERDRIDKGSWRVVEMTIEAAEHRHAQAKNKAVAASYEQAANQVADDLGAWHPLVSKIHQLAAKSQESECTCGPTGSGLHIAGCPATKLRGHGLFAGGGKIHECPTYPDCKCGLPDDSVEGAGLTWDDFMVQVHDAPPSPAEQFTKDICWRVP